MTTVLPLTPEERDNELSQADRSMRAALGSLVIAGLAENHGIM